MKIKVKRNSIYTIKKEFDKLSEGDIFYIDYLDTYYIKLNDEKAFNIENKSITYLEKNPVVDVANKAKLILHF